MPKLLKVDPRGEDPAEKAAAYEYYRSLDTATRFRMIIERSVLLLKLANRNGADRQSPRLSKRLK